MRRQDREITDPEEILEIVRQAKTLRLGLFDEGYPYVVPLHYGFEYDRDRHTLTFYMHGAKEGRKLDLIEKDPRVCVELETAAEQISGGEIPCRYGTAYASVIGRGRAELVQDPQEKIKGLQLLMRSQTGRSFEIDAGMAASVAVIKAVIPEFTAKARRRAT